MDCSGIWCASLALPQSLLVPPPLYAWLAWTPTSCAQRAAAATSDSLVVDCFHDTPNGEQLFLRSWAKNFWKVPPEKFLRLLFSTPCWTLSEIQGHTCRYVVELSTYKPILYYPRSLAIAHVPLFWFFFGWNFCAIFDLHFGLLWHSVLPSTQAQMISPETYILCPCFCPPYNFSGDHLSCLTGNGCIDWVLTSSWLQISFDL